MPDAMYQKVRLFFFVFEPKKGRSGNVNSVLLKGNLVHDRLRSNILSALMISPGD